MVGRGAVQHQERPNPLDQFRLAADMAHARANRLRPPPRRWRPAAAGSRSVATPRFRRLEWLHRLSHRQQRRQPGAVIGNARTAQIAVAVDGDVFFDAGRKHRVEMRRQRDQRALRDRHAGKRDISGAVDSGMPAEGAELRGHPFGALLLEKRRRGHAAQLQMDFVHPLLFAREPLQRLAHAGALGHFADCHRRGQEIGRHILSLPPPLFLALR